jgi:hypothetical protein
MLQRLLKDVSLDAQLCLPMVMMVPVSILWELHPAISAPLRLQLWKRCPNDLGPQPLPGVSSNTVPKL